MAEDRQVTGVLQSLDDLDRLAFRLARTIRTQYPHLLTHGFTLADLEERLLPYREVRRELADAGADAFERALLRLVAGERAYVTTDPALQAACHRALLLPSPPLSMVRAWATTALRLVPSTIPTPPATTPVSDEVFPLPGEPARPDHAPPCQTCRYCDNRLPLQRSVRYCPHCGLDLTRKHCQACSTELDVAWRHCVTCGRRDA